MEKLLFGISGLPIGEEGQKFNYATGIEYLKKIGLEAMELPFVRSVNVTAKNRDKIIEAKEKNEFYLSAHGSYFINLNAEEEEKKEKRYGQCKREYDREKAKLDELYAQKEQARREALQYLKNRCGDIYRLDGSLLAILEKYMTGQKKKEGEEKEAATPTPSPTYFPMKLLSAVYEKCNGEQFEAISELDFYASMNLQPCEGKL